MSNKAGPSSISQGSLLDLRAITAEHVDKFAKEGKKAVKGQPRNRNLEKSKDPFDRPSPGLVKRLAAEARNDAKARRFAEEDGPSEDQRKAILRAKARKYAAIRKGDFTGMSQKEMEEAVIDFERKLEEDGYSSHSSDEDESARPARPKWHDEDEEEDDEEDDLAKVEYIDEMGRTRTGTRKEAKEAERQTSRDARGGPPVGGIESGQEGSAYAEVLQSNVIHGDQNFFPVYEPDADALKKKYLEAEEEARAHHYDSTKEVRVRGAGQYQFSLDEDTRAEQMASLASQRKETEQARSQQVQRGLSAAQEARKRKADERKALIDAKRAKMLGGPQEVERLREERKKAEADAFLKGLEDELGTSTVKHEDP
ncbi:uncharacterized protein I303_108437 [Kwoniella dejecticola CBS 10117]|uniref:Uncharacterized protein n=1 Tax=Kwoniella dejecticola CBS 10117 TaxID=1296121 RepID=A0A1A5ZXF3_9TREE|nr:uncharacterized protein I303_07238 [Kwoniella dejecticola CBS 10117]OBR82478.1 hypothetical protein I303_07238 [Kwoniella dejecticola CBS 10117]